MEVHVHLLQ